MIIYMRNAYGYFIVVLLNRLILKIKLKNCFHIYIYVFLCIEKLFMKKSTWVYQEMNEVLLVKFSLFVAWKNFCFTCITSCCSYYWECCNNEIFGELFSSLVLIISGTSIVFVKSTKDKLGPKHSAISFLKTKSVKAWG